MSKYGFNENEVVQTKVTLIDKDGFYKESDEVPSEKSEGLNLKQGLYLYSTKEDLDDTAPQNITAIIVFDKNNTPDLFTGSTSILNPILPVIYFGDAINDEDISVVETTTPFGQSTYMMVSNEEKLGVGFANGVITSCGVFIDRKTFIDIVMDIHTPELQNVEEGTLVHAAHAFYDEDNGSLFVKQIHSAWHIIND